MPTAIEPPAAAAPQAPLAESTVEQELQFPPVTQNHILHCSYDYWFPKFRTSCIRSRIIPLTPEFIAYLRADGIMLADNEDEGENDDPAESDGEEEDDEPTPPHRQPPNRLFPALHAEIATAIASLGGAVAPKLNWSAPKDAAFISRHPNTMKCTTANDVYLLLKSSNFIVHDLDHAFDDTVPSSTISTTTTTTNHPAPTPSPTDQSTTTTTPSPPLPYHPILVLRSWFDPLPSLEFRCFVHRRRLVAISQRDPGAHYAFLASPSSPSAATLRKQVVARAGELFHRRLRRGFPEESFVFDVYIPEAGYNDEESGGESRGDGEEGRESTRLGRARLIDINPWAPRTDTLLFGWGELLKMGPPPLLGTVSTTESPSSEAGEKEGGLSSSTEEGTDEDEEDEPEPELRLVDKDDPAAFNFGQSPYAAHKLPKEVVDASQLGEGALREFAQQWKEIMEGGQPLSESDSEE